jgi:hypothetical protein
VVELGTERYPVRLTPKRRLRQVDFIFNGSEIRGLEQNPETKSRWAQMARSGKKVMQFLSEGRYVANVVDGKVIVYGNPCFVRWFCSGRVLLLACLLLPMFFDARWRTRPWRHPACFPQPSHFSTV